MKKPAGTRERQQCGTPYRSEFTLTLQEALRDGAITHGVEVPEKDLRFAETHARQVRS